jgi:hypothetical protein
MFDFKINFEIGQTGYQAIGQKPKFLSPTKSRDNLLYSGQVV